MVQHPGRTSQPDDEDEEPFGGLVRYERHMPIHQVSYYLCGELQAPQYYTELFYTLRTAAETDLIYLHINSPGGDFNTGLQIINNMLASEAHVVTVLEARAYSMAAFIFLSGDELIVHDNCQLMFHIYSGSFAGKGNEQQAEIIAVSNWFEKVMERICMPFLSESEIGKILKGQRRENPRVVRRWLGLEPREKGVQSRATRGVGRTDKGMAAVPVAARTD